MTYLDHKHYFLRCEADKVKYEPPFDDPLHKVWLKQKRWEANGEKQIEGEEPWGPCEKCIARVAAEAKNPSLKKKFRKHKVSIWTLDRI